MSLPFSEQERQFWDDKLYRCAVLHDLGKIHTEFQRRLAGQKIHQFDMKLYPFGFVKTFLSLVQTNYLQLLHIIKVLFLIWIRQDVLKKKI